MNIQRAISLWTFNRIEVVRSLWNVVHVPVLTRLPVRYLSVLSDLEVLGEKGRLALGAHRLTPNETVQGDVGWSLLKAREVVAKLGFKV